MNIRIRGGLRALVRQFRLLFWSIILWQAAFGPVVVGAIQEIPPPARQVGDTDTFGSIDEVLPLTGTRLVVLDKINSRLTLHDSTGSVLSELGRRGFGPGEFFDPVALLRLGPDEFWVLDRGSLRLTQVTADGDSLRVVGDVPTPFAAGDMCAIGERVYLLGLFEEAVLHEFDSGQVLRSFGEVEGQAVEQALSSLAKMACSFEHQAIAVVTESLGDLQIFQADGTKTYVAPIPEYSRVIYEVGLNAVRPKMPPSGIVHLAKSVLWHGDTVVVQLGRAPDDGSVVWEERRLSLQDRSWQSTPPRLPTILGREEGWLYTTLDIPFPVLYLYRIGQ